MKQQFFHIDQNDFAVQYSLLREKEERLYSDEEVLCLPVISTSHRYYKEWQMRKQSAARLISFLQSKKKRLKILEVGCGNGWLGHWLAAIDNSNVTGIDIHFPEIQQAARVFSTIDNLHFIYGDIGAGIFKEKQFDIIVFAASIQYFVALPELLKLALSLLNENGEVVSSPTDKPSSFTVYLYTTTARTALEEMLP